MSAVPGAAPAVVRYDVQANLYEPAGDGVRVFWQTVNSPGQMGEALRLADHAARLNGICFRVVERDLATGRERTIHEAGTHYPPFARARWAER